MQESTLTIDKLACRRGERLLFRGFDLSLAAGDIVHIAGANGIGKSSLMRILAGLLRPYAGKIAFSGTRGLLDEKHSLDEQATVKQALGFWTGADKRTQDDMNAALAQMAITDLADIPVRYLSTGQRKRAGFTRLLIQRPAIWLLDEPVNGLDTSSQKLVSEQIAAHAQDGGICVIASHLPLTLAGMQTVALADFTP